MARIFISYARDDGLEIARELADRLRATDHEVFLDLQSIRAGSRWRSELDRRIKWSDLIVVLVTEGSNNSDYVYEEIIKADKQGKVIVPIRVNDTPLPIYLRGTWQAVMLEDDDVDGVLLELERTLRQLSKPRLRSRGCIFLGTGIVIAVALLAVFLVIPVLNEDDEKPTTEPTSIAQLTEEAAPPTVTDTPTDVAQITETVIPTDTIVPTDAPTETPIPTSTSTDTPIPTNTPVFFPVGSHNTDWTPHIQEFDGVEMVLVPAGCFKMGSEYSDNDEAPVHEVCFEKQFWIGRFEVSNSQYGSSGFFSGDDRPRESITWIEAKVFCESRNARLPTEAEWEYAARGPEGWIYPWGNEFVSDNLVYGNNSNAQTAPVAMRSEGISWVGASDMIGNVWEWVADWYGLYGSDRQINPTGPDTGEDHVIRGGGWRSVGDDLHTSNRSSRPSDFKDSYIGFRCARDN